MLAEAEERPPRPLSALIRAAGGGYARRGLPDPRCSPLEEREKAEERAAAGGGYQKRPLSCPLSPLLASAAFRG